MSTLTQIIADAYRKMVNPPAPVPAARPKWVPVSITEENVTAFVQAITEARKANESIVEFNGKKYGIKKEETNKEDDDKAKKIQDMDAEKAPKQPSDEVPTEVKEEDSEEIKVANVADKAADADDMEKVDSAEDMVKEEDAEEIQADSNSEADDKADKRGEMDEELVGNQKKLDVNKNGKIDGDDLKKLRGMKNESTESLDESMDKMSKPDLWVAHANHKMDSDPEISMDRKNVHHHAKAAAAIEKHVAAKFGDQHATAMKSHTDLIHGVKTQMNSPESDKEDLRDARKLRKQHGASHDAFNHLGESADADSDDKPADHAEPDADNMGGPSDHDADNEGEDEKKEDEKPKMTGEQVLRSVASAYAAMVTENDEYAGDNPVDKLHFDVPAFIKVLERAREEFKSDEDIHNFTQELLAMKSDCIHTADLPASPVKEETENDEDDEDDEDEKDSEKGPDSAEAGPEVMDPATQKMKDDMNKNVEIKDGVPGSAQDGADDLNPANKPAPANKSAALPKVAIVDASTKLGESIMTNEAMTAIVSRKNSDGSYNEVGMNDRTVIHGSLSNILNKAKAYAKGPHRVELFHGDRIGYGAPHKVIHSE